MELLAGRGIASEPFRAHLNPFEPVQLHEKKRENAFKTSSFRKTTCCRLFVPVVVIQRNAFLMRKIRSDKEKVFEQVNTYLDLHEEFFGF